MPDFEPREKLIGFVRAVLHGPAHGEREAIDGTPFLRYLTGMLFPQGEEVRDGTSDISATAEDESVEPSDAGDSEGATTAESVHLAFEALPSAMGLSLKVPDKAQLRCRVSAARYEQAPRLERGGGRARDTWHRQPLPSEGAEEVRITKDEDAVSLFGGLARLHVRWRSASDDTAVVTVTVVNEQKNAGRGLNPAKTLFQVHLECEPVGTDILPYPEFRDGHSSETEEAEISYLYRTTLPYARGHGCSATWQLDHNGACRSVRTDFLPTADVPYATFSLVDESVDSRCLDLAFIDSAPRDEVIGALATLVRGYESWLTDKRNAELPEEFVQVAERFISRAVDWLERARVGLRLLQTNPVAWTCFRLANTAMGMQMVFSRNLRNGHRKVQERASPPKLDLSGLSWRPFQIAFMLACVDSLVSPDSKHQETVDVIWFPTGGGKTEAYLFIAAFELLRRRMLPNVSDEATGILSRYTLRLLTAQQFQRTAALIVALECLRRLNASVLGQRPFSLGLWVGAKLTPNRIRKAHDLFNEMLESEEPKNPFLLEACPLCATEIVPQARRRNKHDFGIHSTEAEFFFRCPNIDCEFNSKLPLNVVDEALYADPPSMLLGTVDKFAQLTWNDRARVFLGGLSDASMPPSLIIQDELHLISGPLGSLAAPYEAALDAIAKVRGGKVKRIASTATIRNASEQVRALYGRSAAVFPSPCGRWDDAYFFRTDLERPGRKYIGIMGQGYIKPVVAMAWTAAALLQCTQEVALDDETLDAYRTLLAYHNSRRELGRTLTAAQDEVATRIKTIASSSEKARTLSDPLELSAQMVASMNVALGELNRKHKAHSPAVDFVPCTSIISVGVDVDRLALMMVNGQPKLTSEYIQATSRVGRGKVPGLVATLYSPSKPRDRSHYEDFKAYHQAIYRHVEPTSVTPYALPARERTLHASLVAVIRHALPWHQFDQAGSVDFDAPETKYAIECMLEVMRRADETEASAIAALLADRINQWQEFAEANAPLLYDSKFAGAQFAGLLYEFGKASGRSLWPTMTSVRNVDAEIPIVIQ
jgi:hypothetical protein